MRPACALNFARFLKRSTSVQAVEGLDSSCALKLERLDSSGTRVGSNIDLEDCDLQLPDTSSSSSVQVVTEIDLCFLAPA